MRGSGRKRVLTWHVHGTYLQILGHVDHDFLVPVRQGRRPGYAGLPPGREWPSNLVEIPADEVAGADVDCVLYQSDENWDVDRFEVLTGRQRRLPAIYLEHDPPGHDGGSCFGTRHPAADSDATVVHVTHFNDLMWDCGASRTEVIEHAVPDRGFLYRGDLDRGLVVVNNMAQRGRRLGRDVFERARERLPLDLIGMGSEELGGVGEVPPDEVGERASRYRFFFHPIRHTSLGLALCEAMMIGMPVVALATTEAVTVVENGVSGFIDTDTERLVAGMSALLAAPDLALEMGLASRKTALQRFGMDRFKLEWRALIDRLSS